MSALARRWPEFLVAGVLAMVGAILLAPLWSGYRVGLAFDRLPARIAALDGVGLRVLARERGWFESRFDTEVLIRGHAPLRLTQRVVHGPLYLGMLRRGRSPLLGAHVLIRRAGVVNPLAELTIRLDGGWSLLLEEASLLLPGARPAQRGAVFTGVHGDLRFSPPRRALDISLRARHVGFQLGARRYELGALAMLGQYRLGGAGGLPFGDTALRVASLRVPGALFEGLDLSLATVENGAELEASVLARCAALSLEEEPLGLVTGEVLLRRLNAETIAGLFAERALPDVAALLRRLRGAVVRVVEVRTHEPERDAVFRGRLTVNAPGEPGAPAWHGLVLDATLELTPPLAEALFRQQARLMLGRSELFGKLNELERAERDAVARASASKQLAVLAGRGYISLNRGRYRTRIELREGALALNGRPVAGAGS